LAPRSGNLSVQVHPTQAYAERHPGVRPKFEAWVVLEADPGSVIYAGLRHGTDLPALAAAARSGTLVPLLRTVPARPGECHDLPAGTCHALGGGIVVAEVQTPSDTTFRLDDWGRRDRDLHIEEALECVDLEAPPEAGASQARSPRRPILVNGLETTELLETDHFSIERIEARASAELPVITSNLPVAWMVVAGRAEVSGGGVAATLDRGRTVLFPAGLEGGRARLAAGCSLLRITLPSPARGLLA
jgi:mannose-6-phosphate isomerase